MTKTLYPHKMTHVHLNYVFQMILTIFGEHLLNLLILFKIVTISKKSTEFVWELEFLKFLFYFRQILRNFFFVRNNSLCSNKWNRQILPKKFTATKWAHTAKLCFSLVLNPIGGKITENWLSQNEEQKYSEI